MSRDRPSAPPQRAKLFWNGRSQAVRLPKEFRFPGDEVEIRREGNEIVLAPVARTAWPDGYWRWLEQHEEELDVEVEPLGAKLLDVRLDDE